MIYITGDTHGNQLRWVDKLERSLIPSDCLIVAGDFGIGFFDGPKWTEEEFFDYLEEQDYTILFCDGNHENFEKLNSYGVEDWHGGKVHVIRRNVLHLMRGEVYELDGKKLFVMGGGYSLDKAIRKPYVSWWPDEMPNKGEYDHAYKNLKLHDFKVDYVLSHTAPVNTIEYMTRKGLGISGCIPEEYELTGFLQWVSEKASYEKWYFGHFHVDEELWKNQYAVLNAIRELGSGRIADVIK